ncbi:MAG: regulatory iron-sulfur-containing complex subunit RicT [Brevinematia bacterium]
MSKCYYVKTYVDNTVSIYKVEEDIELSFGDFVIVETKFGNDIGKVLSGEIDTNTNNGKIISKATKEDIEKFNKNRNRDLEEGNNIRKILKKHHSEVHFVNCYFLFEKKLLVNFISESRIDFRELVKELAGIYRMRIEMRQISSREAFKIKGGIGICGMECCCSRFNHLKQHISANLVKEQNLSETNAKTIGPCGKLLCCLAYEADSYKNGKCIYAKTTNNTKNDVEIYEGSILDNT